MPDGVSALEYHERTKHSPESVRSGAGLDFDNKPLPYKRYTDRPQVGLPADPPGPATPALAAVAVDRPSPPVGDPFEEADPARIDRETLAQLCHYAAGVTKEVQLGNRSVAFRAAACTGALYHIDLYPVVGDLDGLDAGVYHYDPETDALDVLREGDYRGVLAEASASDRVAGAPVTFVATSTWWRNAWKYRERTFRHAFWDSGTVLANLVGVAHAGGLPASVGLGFADDTVVDLLGLDPTDEAPLELVPVGHDGPASAPPTVEPIDFGTEPLSPDPTSYPLIPRAWRAGTLADGDAAASWRDEATTSAPVGASETGDGERVTLEPVDAETASRRPLGNTVTRRGSCRAYEREPVSFGMLSTVLDRAIRAVPLDVRPAEGAPLQYTDAYIIANDVEGLESGVYQLHPADGSLERLRAGEFRQEAGHLALDQRLGADAAACLYFMADLESITAELDDRGYRVAQFEAAMTAGRLYLATYAHRRLGGTGLTFYDDEVTAFLAPRAAGQTPMFLYTIGRPA